MVTAALRPSPALGVTTDDLAFVSLVWYGMQQMQPEALQWQDLRNLQLPRIVACNSAMAAERFMRRPEAHDRAVCDYVAQPLRAAALATICSLHGYYLQNVVDLLFKAAQDKGLISSSPEGSAAGRRPRRGQTQSLMASAGRQ